MLLYYVTIINPFTASYRAPGCEESYAESLMLLSHPSQSSLYPQIKKYSTGLIFLLTK